MVLLLALLRRRSSRLGAPAGSGVWLGSSLQGQRVARKDFLSLPALGGLVFMGRHLSGEAVPSKLLMLSAGLGPLPCKSP